MEATIGYGANTIPSCNVTTLFPPNAVEVWIRFLPTCSGGEAVKHFKCTTLTLLQTVPCPSGQFSSGNHI